MANHRCQIGLDSIAPNPPGLPHIPAQDVVLLHDHLLIHLGLGLVVKCLVLITSSRTITGLFYVIASVPPCTFKSGFKGGKACPIFIPVDVLRIDWVPQSPCRNRRLLISRWHCSWGKVFHSSMLVHIICAYDFVRMISLCVWFGRYDLLVWTRCIIWGVIKEERRKRPVPRVWLTYFWDRAISNLCSDLLPAGPLM